MAKVSMRLQIRLPSETWNVLILVATVLSFTAFALQADDLMRATAGQHADAIQGSAETVVLARQLQQRLRDLERSTRWLLAFSEPDLVTGDERSHYDKARALLHDALQAIRANVAESPANGLLLQVDQLAEEEHLIHERVQSMLTGAPRASLDEGFAAITALSVRLSASASRGLDQQFAKLEAVASAQRYRLSLLAIVWCLIPVSLIAGSWWTRRRSIRILAERLRSGGNDSAAKPQDTPISPELRALGSAVIDVSRRHVEQHQADVTALKNLLHTAKGHAEAIDSVVNRLARETAGELTDAQVPLVREGTTAAKALVNLVEQSERFLGAAATTAATELTITHVDMRSLIEEVAAAHLAEANARGVRLRLSLEAVTMVGDKQSLSTMVDGLVSNAVKFSPDESEVNIILRALSGNLKLEIEDDGPGIDREERPYVFEPFFVGEATRGTGKAGAGLGLASALESVRMHSGEIVIGDPRHPKRGARLRVQLPLDAHGPTHKHSN